MPGSIVTGGDASAAPFGEHVEVAQGDRIRPRATYRGRRFRLMSVDASRYRWRCSVSTCPSKLMTDKFGERHVLYSFKDHDEKEHRAVEERRRSNKAFRSEAVEKIGEFMYVLERTMIDLKCWRCQYVSCSGRCRTSLDGKTLLHGPTPHTCQALTPQKEQHARPLHDEPVLTEHTPAGPSQSVTSTSTDASVQQRQQPQHMDVADNKEESRGSQGRSSVPAQSPRETALKIDSSESDADDDDMNDEESSKIGGDEHEGQEERSRSMGGGRSNAAGIGSIASAAEVLRMMSGSCECAQDKLRAAIYARALDLQVKEEKLLEVQMRNEVARGRLLDSLMKNGPSAPV
ncbi:uncharacterized protein LOC119396553 isoform X4 [Rhipicephalus sanguineus]|uniref:FLYWCH-type domain-containing protein n=1 Tax=Rhipicephalus sanguineus TaxID=34632 RepID=A0A9D4PNG7_RHISA|nr:uncharacterized protein LOC119396553 isoform X4 [Rhipicephalus sanguineus]KAH7947303.1 hypothetical protein HPB52_009791 [Rhipicephalus sanguineus]